jgi:hypothetical protein
VPVVREPRDDAVKKRARFLPKPQFLEGHEGLPARRLIHPTPAAFADVPLRHLWINRPADKRVDRTTPEDGVRWLSALPRSPR